MASRELGKDTFIKESDNLVILGNGVSLAHICYHMLPQSFDVFRCNQFYQEERYFLGRKIKLVSLNLQVAYENLRTYQKLQYNGEYCIDHIVLNYFDPFKRKLAAVHRLLPEIESVAQLVRGEKKLLAFLEYNEYRYNRRPSSGVILAILGTLLGYKNFYFAGVDLMQKVAGKHYNYDLKPKVNTHKLNIYRDLDSAGDSIHQSDYEIAVLHYLAEHYGVSLLSLTHPSPLNAHLNTAPILNHYSNDDFNEAKADNATLDFILPSETEILYKQFLTMRQSISLRDHLGFAGRKWRSLILRGWC